VTELSGSRRVLHLLAPTREGGLEQVVTMMSAGQKSGGVHVGAVLSPDVAEGHPFIARLEGIGVPVTAVVVPGRSYLREYQSISSLVARLQPAVVHTHGYHADVIGGAVARANGIRTISTVHGFTRGVIRNGLYEWVQAIALRRADGVIAVSAPLVDLLVKAGVRRNRIHCIPNGFAPVGEPMLRAAARRKLGIAEDNLVAGWVGRLSKEKGADVMLDALAMSDPAWRLSMIGEGRDRDRLEQRAAKLGITDRVRWHGHVDGAGLLLTAFDAFVLSSRTEGTPITLFEAMRASVPIVATRVGGVPDVVSIEDALLVTAEQPGQIARALAEIAGDSEAALERSVHARARAAHSFNAAAWLSAVDAVYQATSTRHFPGLALSAV
jgi:glycosyltransferase involved in cell wall biosynthesis